MFPRRSIARSQRKFEFVHREFPWACHEGAIPYARRMARSEHMTPGLKRGVLVSPVRTAVGLIRVSSSVVFGGTSIRLGRISFRRIERGPSDEICECTETTAEMTPWIVIGTSRTASEL